MKAAEFIPEKDKVVFIQGNIRETYNKSHYDWYRKDNKIVLFMKYNKMPVRTLEIAKKG